MRITGGSAKGQILKTVPGPAVRPTTDRVREAIFSMLGSLAGGQDRGLDLYAGSGALGIEALSRDAGWMDFVDQNNRCCQVIKQNLQKTGFAGRSHVYCCPVGKALGFLGDSYDFIFLDPPYADTTLGATLAGIAGSKLVAHNSIVLASHSSRSALEDRYDGLSRIKEKKYGDTCISIYRKEDSA